MGRLKIGGSGKTVCDETQPRFTVRYMRFAASHLDTFAIVLDSSFVVDVDRIRHIHVRFARIAVGLVRICRCVCFGEWSFERRRARPRMGQKEANIGRNALVENKSSERSALHGGVGMKRFWMKYLLMQSMHCAGKVLKAEGSLR